MKEAIVSAGPKVQVVDSPIPEPGDSQVLIKVAVSGSNPKDWKYTELRGFTGNAGDDIAGIVEKVGKNVVEFKPGDRVGAFHEMFAPGGSYAEYALAWDYTTFHLPNGTSFEDAAALPLAYGTAAVGLYDRLRLPTPWAPAQGEEIPLVIYGAASGVGIYTLQLALRSNIHPIIAVAGSSQAHVEKFLDRSKGDTVVDYRKGDDAVVEGIKAALGGRKLLHAYDAVAEKGSAQNIARALAPGGLITTVLPVKEEELPSGTKVDFTYVGELHKGLKDFGYVYFRFLTRALTEGWFKAQPQEVSQGLESIGPALVNLRDGKAHGVKYVFRIADL